jgi:hypothetical protein
MVAFERVQGSIDRSLIRDRGSAGSRGRMGFTSRRALMRRGSSSEELLDGRSDSTTTTALFGFSVRGGSSSSRRGSRGSRSFGVMGVIGRAKGNEVRINGEDQNERVLKRSF